MHEAVGRYLAVKVVEDIRTRRPLASELAFNLNSLPLIDFIRPLIDADDVPTLLRLSNSDADGVRSLAFSLLKKVDNDPNIMSVLKTVWDSRTDFATRNNIMWRILDFEELDDAFHHRIFSFVKEHQDEFLEGQLRFMGGSRGGAGVLDSVRARLGDKDFPGTKHWAYVFAALASTDKEGTRALVREYQDRPDSIMRTVVRYCLDQIG